MQGLPFIILGLEVILYVDNNGGKICYIWMNDPELNNSPRN